MIDLESLWNGLRGNQPFIFGGMCAAFAILLVHQCNRADSAESKLKRAGETAVLTDAGRPPLAEGSAKDLKSALADEKARSTYFKASADDTLKALTDLKAHPKIVEVVKWRTKPGVASGPPLPPLHDLIPGCPPEPPCLVRPDTKLAIEADEGRVETRSGNRLVIGSAKVLRLDPPFTIFEQEIDMKITSGIVEAKPEPAAERPWIAGVTASVNPDRKWGIGPNLGYFGSRFGGNVALTFGSGGVALASAFARF
jgi:hypothetical protein